MRECDIHFLVIAVGAEKASRLMVYPIQNGESSMWLDLGLKPFLRNGRMAQRFLRFIAVKVGKPQQI